jgi:hypothetical protein
LPSHAALNFNSASRRIDGAGELHQHSVSGGLDDASAMRGDGWIDKGFPDRLELGQRTFFIGTHQAAIPGDVSRQHRR